MPNWFIRPLVSLIGGTAGGAAFLRSSRGHALRHWYARHFEDRHSYTFTQFYRLPTQFAALLGPVLTRLEPIATPLRIAVLGCSNGAEPYGISSVLLHARPDLEVAITGYDIDPEMIEVGRKAAYPRGELFPGHVPEWFLRETFEPGGDHLVVRPRVAARVSLRQADLLDPGLVDRIGPVHIVFLQNVLCNLRRLVAGRILANLAPLFRPGVVLFADGIDLDIRSRFTEREGLVPLDYEIERIHGEACWVRGDRYPWFAAGLEPFDSRRRDWLRRYATIFYRPPGPGS